MKSIIIIILLVGVLPAIVSAHLCNDVFSQAQDNLAVKVDIRDGQLRISERATFRVYLLNTMDRTIDDIHLEVLTAEFQTKVSPSREWKRFPALPVRQKQYFEVELIRKSKTESGKYKIDLRLFSGNQTFKTINIDEALCAMHVPEHSQPLNVDGNVSASEWRNSLLCTSLYEYKKGSGFFRRYMENIPSKMQTRFRFSRYKNTLYCLIDFMNQSRSDVARIYVARDHESEPTVIVADLHQKKAFVEGKRPMKLNTAVKENKMEIELPFDALQIVNQQSFYVNVTRDYNDITTYWLGNSQSVTDPIVYAMFIF